MGEETALDNRGDGNRRQIYEHRDPDYLNTRTVSVRSDGAVVFEGYDSDKELEQFIGRDEWEGELTVAAGEVPKLRQLLELAFGPLSEAKRSEAEELLDLIEKGFGGQLSCMTRFEQWCREQGIAFDQWTH
ncbi:MAG: hypothetical protein EXR51_09660 [Dehalococcoidia bacterium]|nr:hypothetical protein [Dehalococcoidia bacterium]